MRKNLLWLLIPAVLLIAMAPVLAQAQQRLTNGGFETWTAGPGGPPDGWVYGTHHISAVQEISNIRSGSYAAKVVFDSSGTLQFNTNSITVVPGQTYSCSLWVYDNYSTPDNCRMRPWFFFSPSGSGGPTTYSVDTAGYKLYTYSMAAPVGASSLVLQLRAYGGAYNAGHADSFWVDDAGLYGPAPNVAPSVGAPVRVPTGIIYNDTYVNIHSLITDSDGTIASDSLYLQLNGGGYAPFAHDSIDGSGNYWYHVGTNPTGTVVDYYVVATDNGGSRVQSTSDTYTVVAGNSAPTIGVLTRTPAGKLFYDQDVSVHASIADLDGTIASDNLYLQLNGGGYSPVAHDSIVGGQYWYHIGIQAAGTAVDYYISATDDDGANTQSPTSHYTVHGSVPIALIQHSAGPGVWPGNCFPTDSLNTIEQVTGIVTARYQNSVTYKKRFCLQDASSPDGGLFVFGTPDTVQVGDSVTVRGTLTEYSAETELGAPFTFFVKHTNGNPLPAPVVLTVATLGTDSCTAAAEQYEDMYIQFNNVTITSAAPYGDYWLNDGSGDSCLVHGDMAVASPDPPVFTVGQTYTHIRGACRYLYYQYGIAVQSNADLYIAPILPGTIAGTVYGPDHVTPLSGVTVTTRDASENIVGTNTSNVNGSWSLDLMPGTYHEILVKAGYVDTTIASIVVTSSNTTNVSTSMRIQEVVCTGGTIYNIENSLTPGSDPDCWPSPYNGQTTTICGVVTASAQGPYKNFFLQDQNNTAWGGIYCYDFTLPNGDTIFTSVGDYVQLTAKVSEYYGWTELDSVTDFQCKSLKVEMRLPD